MRIENPHRRPPRSPKPFYLPQGVQVAHPNSGMGEASLSGCSTQHSCQGQCGRTSGLVVGSDEGYCCSSRRPPRNSVSGALHTSRGNRQGLAWTRGRGTRHSTQAPVGRGATHQEDLSSPRAQGLSTPVCDADQSACLCSPVPTPQSPTHSHNMAMRSQSPQGGLTLFGSVDLSCYRPQFVGGRSCIKH